MKGDIKQKIAIIIGVIVSLIIAWHLGTTPSQTVVYTPYQIEQQEQLEEPQQGPLEDTASHKEQPHSPDLKGNDIQEEHKDLAKDSETVKETQSLKDTKENSTDLEEKGEKLQPPNTSGLETSSDGKTTSPSQSTPPASVVVEVADETLEAAQTDKKKADALKQEIIEQQDTSKKDRYMTDPVPEGKPKPVEPQDVAVNEKKSFKVKLSVSCGTILNNMNLLDKNKYELVPEDGVIFPLQEVIAYEGESVFNVLLREMQNHKIHMEFVNTPMYNSAYIEGINNLYEFDVGELSGWMYKVNEWFPNYGCSRYQLQEGDIIEWVYTCDLGRDVGDSYYDNK